MVELSKKDDEKDVKERIFNGLLESIVLFIRKADFERLLKPSELKIKPLFRQAATEMEGFINELHAWLGLDKDFLLYHLSDFKNEPLNVLSMKIIKVLKEQEEELNNNKDKLKKLEVDKKVKEIEVLKKKISEIDEKKAKDITEKLAKFRSIGSSQDERLIEKIVKDNLKSVEINKS